MKEAVDGSSRAKLCRSDFKSGKYSLYFIILRQLMFLEQVPKNAFTEDSNIYTEQQTERTL